MAVDRGLAEGFQTDIKGVRENGMAETLEPLFIAPADRSLGHEEVEKPNTIVFSSFDPLSKMNDYDIKPYEFYGAFTGFSF